MRDRFSNGRFKTIHGMNRTPTYFSWVNMINRCTSPKSKQYKNYGARGINVCKRWRNFVNFLEDMGIKPTNLTLDRIDNDKGYSKNNCRWASRKVQNLNRRKLRNCTSKFTGVFFEKRRKKWVAQIFINNKSIYLGLYKKEVDAAKAYNEAALVHHGEFARLNKVKMTQPKREESEK